MTKSDIELYIELATLKRTNEEEYRKVLKDIKNVMKDFVEMGFEMREELQEKQ